MNIQTAITAAADKIIADHLLVSAALEAAKLSGVDLRTIGAMRRAAVAHLLDEGMAEAGFSGDLIAVALGDIAIVSNMTRALKANDEKTRAIVCGLVAHAVEVA